MAEFSIADGTLDLAERMAPRLRAPDTAEVWAARHWTPSQALAESVRVSEGVCWAWLVDGEPAAMWGVQPVSLTAGVGMAWLLGTDAIAAHPVRFWQLCKREIARLLTFWRVLFNWIDCRYEASIRWAARLGFLIDPPNPYGADNMLFCCAAIVR